MYKLNTNSLFGCEKLIGYRASAVNMVSSYPCVGRSLRIKVSLFLLSIWRNEFISARKIMTFFPMLPLVKKKSERESILCCSRYFCIYLDQHS